MNAAPVANINSITADQQYPEQNHINERLGITIRKSGQKYKLLTTLKKWPTDKSLVIDRLDRRERGVNPRRKRHMKSEEKRPG
jgi:hypothetical protein